MAAQDNTNCTFKTTNFTLSQGESYYSGAVVVNYGDTLTCNKPVQADLASGDTAEGTGQNGSYESRWYPLYPTNQWSTGYYSPVGRSDPGFPSRVFIYNGNASQITVTWTRYNCTPSTGTFTVAAGETNFYDIDCDSGTSFTSSLPFFAIQAVDLPNPNSDSQSQYYDWGFTLIPQNLASDELVVGWGPGTSNLSGNGSPVWVTAVDSGNTTIYVDYDGNPATGANTDPNGNKYDVSYTLSQYQSRRLYDTTNSDRDQTRPRLHHRRQEDRGGLGRGRKHGQRNRSLSRPGHHRPAAAAILGGKSAELATDLTPSGDKMATACPARATCCVSPSRSRTVAAARRAA